MQVQNQTQQISEEFLLPLSEDELASIAGGRFFLSHLHRLFLSQKELDDIKHRLVARPYRPNPLDIAQFGRKKASLAC